MVIDNVHSYKVSCLYLFWFLSYAGLIKKKKKKMMMMMMMIPKLPIIAPYIYDARYHAIITSP